MRIFKRLLSGIHRYRALVHCGVYSVLSILGFVQIVRTLIDMYLLGMPVSYCLFIYMIAVRMYKTLWLNNATTAEERNRYLGHIGL
jgi:hypothetical protein